ncbi:Vacuolar-sorting protein SNF7 [Coemansia sp. RSA 1358]|nr:Vacuolar-sorting protein SNF7 [Coemansia sp. RSA 1358]
MPLLVDTLFQLKFTAKSLARQAKQCEKDEQREKVKLKKAIKKGDTEIARIHASNAIRKKNEYVNLTKLASRIDAVSSRVQTAVTMHKVTGSMTNVVRGMDRAMESMNLERISQVMDKFESQFEDLDVQTEYLEGTIGGATTLSTPQEDVDTLMQQVADEAGLEVNQELGVMEAPQELPKEEELTERLARLRNAS